MPVQSQETKEVIKAYGDSMGPLGYRMTSNAASELDRILKSVSTECRSMGLMRICPEVKAMETSGLAFDDGEHADISFVTTADVDRDREVVLPKGGDWKQFQKNPVVTFAHNYDQPPIGRSLWVKRETKGNTDGWLAKTRYTARPDSKLLPDAAEWFPDIIWHFVQSKDLPGKSIGFIALNFRPPDEKEITANPAYAKARGMIDKWLALEYAVTPVQSNPTALVTQVAKAKQKGLSVDRFLDEIGLVIPDDLKTLDPPVVSPVASVKFIVVPPRPSIDVVGTFHKRAAEMMNGIDPRKMVQQELRRASGKIT